MNSLFYINIGVSRLKKNLLAALIIFFPNIPLGGQIFHRANTFSDQLSTPVCVYIIQNLINILSQKKFMFRYSFEKFKESNAKQYQSKRSARQKMQKLCPKNPIVKLKENFYIRTKNFQNTRRFLLQKLSYLIFLNSREFLIILENQKKKMNIVHFFR